MSSSLFTGLTSGSVVSPPLSTPVDSLPSSQIFASFVDITPVSLSSESQVSLSFATIAISSSLQSTPSFALSTPVSLTSRVAAISQPISSGKAVVALNSSIASLSQTGSSDPAVPSESAASIAVPSSEPSESLTMSGPSPSARNSVKISSIPVTDTVSAQTPDASKTSIIPIKAPTSASTHVSEVGTSDQSSTSTTESLVTTAAATPSVTSKSSDSDTTPAAPSSSVLSSAVSKAASSADSVSASLGKSETTDSVQNQPVGTSVVKVISTVSVSGGKTLTLVKTASSTIPAQTSTGTVTDQPESTFSHLVAVTITNPANGKTVVSTPPLVTVWSTSTEANGSVVTFTHVVANPTGIISNGTADQPSGASSFFRNRGALAGVFVVVGIAAASLVLCTFFFIRRRRRIVRRRRWIATITQPPPESIDPFQDPGGTSEMRETNSNGDEWGGVYIGDRSHRDDGHLTPLNPVLQRPDVSRNHNAGIGTRSRSNRVSYDSPFSDSFAFEPHPPSPTSIGLAVTTDLAQSRPSLAQSSPSIYPPSLPPTGDNDVDPFYEQEMASDPGHQHPQENTMISVSTTVPRPPPQSHVESDVGRSASNINDFQLLTPPPSISSHSPSLPPSPVSAAPQFLGPSPDERVFESKPMVGFPMRRTLLDVRPRSRDLNANKTLTR